jgi:hypothetical protein
MDSDLRWIMFGDSIERDLCGGCDGCVHQIAGESTGLSGNCLAGKIAPISYLEIDPVSEICVIATIVFGIVEFTALCRDMASR